MIEFKSWNDVPVNFTGICKIIATNYIYHMKDGEFHNEFGPAFIYPYGDKIWFIHGICHREDGPAIEDSNGLNGWYYYDTCYGTGNDFTNETWIEKVRELKLEIFK